jgi:hypothetical protein
MKKLIILLCSATGIISAQSFNQAHHLGSERTFEMACINSKSFYLEKSLQIPRCCNDEINLVGTGKDGNEIFRTVIASGAYMDRNGIAVTVEENLLVFAGTQMKGCDYPGIKYNLAKIDTNGALLWNLPMSRKIKCIIPKPDGSFYLIIDDSVFKYTSQGYYSSKFGPGISNINSAILLSNQKILFNYTSGSAFRFRISDSLGGQVKDTLAGANLGKMALTHTGDIVGHSGTQLRKYMPSLILNSTTGGTIPTGYSLNSFTVKNVSVFAAGKTSSSRPYYMIFDGGLNLTYQSSSNVEKAEATGITVNNNNKVNVITTGSTQIAPSNSFTGFFQTEIQGNLDSKPDIGVTRVVFSDTLYFPQGSSLWYPSINATVTVRNFGNFTTNSFRLNCFAKTGGTSYCLVGLNRFFTANISPGDSVTVTTGSFFTEPFNLSFVPTGQSVTYSLFVNTSVPDLMNDIDVTNDHSYHPIKLIPVGLNENAGQSNNVKIYPNPSSGDVTITSSVRINSIEIFDLTGNMIKNVEVGRNDFYLEDKLLPAGLYIFRINTAGGFVTKRILIGANF